MLVVEISAHGRKVNVIVPRNASAKLVVEVYAYGRKILPPPPQYLYL